MWDYGTIQTQYFDDKLLKQTKSIMKRAQRIAPNVNAKTDRHGSHSSTNTITN